MKFTVDVPDGIVKGVTLARENFNDSLPDVAGQPNPGILATDADYFSSRAIGMVQSWAEIFGVTSTAQDKAKAEFLAKIDPTKRAGVDAAVTAELSK